MFILSFLMTKPNILFLFSDQQRWDTLGCYGQPLDVTPNLDQMAAEGALFEQCHSAQPVCGPTRACLQTGMYASQHGAFTNARRLNADLPLLAPQMKQAGYECAYIGKWHLASHRYRNGEAEDENYRDRGVPRELRGGYDDYWLAADALEATSHSYDGHVWDQDNNRVEFPEDKYRVDVLTDWLIEYLENRDSDKPFYCMCSYLEPHHQNDHNVYEGPHGSKEQFKDYVAPGDLIPGKGDWEENYPDYLGCCHSLDASVGKIRAVLEKLGIADNTIILYTSDHGSHFRCRNGEYKRSPHEASTHVPFLACGPGIPAARFRDMVSLVDVPASILSFAGAEIPETFQGRPVSALFDGVPEDWPSEALVEISESQVGRAIRTDDWLFAVHAPDAHAQKDRRSDVYEDYCLYDLKQDPHELHNLVGDPQCKDIRDQLATRLAARIVAVGDGPVTINEPVNA